MPTKIELKPCPFCGRKAITLQIPDETPYRHPGLWVVGCETEDCFGNYSHVAMMFSSEETAAEAWNTRTSGKWLICCDGYYPYCSNCRKEPPGRVMTDYCPHCGTYMKGGK